MALSSTSFKPGNQAAKGCETSGAPRTVSPPPEEMIALGEEMVAWCKEHKPLHLSQWYSHEKSIVTKDWNTYTQRPEFVEYYEKAMGYVRLNYINGTVNSSVANRFLRLYFSDLKEEENEKMRLEAEINAQSKVNAEIAKGMPPNDKALSELIDTVKEIKDKLG